MKFPIKPNDAFWPGALRRLIGAHLRKDPRSLLQGHQLSGKAFSQAVSNLRLGGTFKTTRPGRHALSNELIRSQGLPEDAVILDLGASDGITSLELMQALNFSFKKYYVTDLFPEVHYLQRGQKVFFFEPRGRCTLIADRFFVYYPQFSRLARRLFRKELAEFEKLRQEGSLALKKVPLIHPALQKEQRQRPQQIHIQRHDLLQKWSEEQPFLIKAANVLNPGYFPPEKLQQALKLIFEALPEKGLFLLVENRIPRRRDESGRKVRREAAALYQKHNGNFQLLAKVGAETELQVKL
ncbi:MAG TPA: hypothetical protein ENJ88_07365 [Phaeodactylibacter sp.]|nr:hypothetical protein [Phaeodactylibacter sp.]